MDYCIDKLRCYSHTAGNDNGFTVKGILFDLGNDTQIYIDGDSSEYDEDNPEGVIECFNPFASIEISEKCWHLLGGLTYYSAALEMPAENILELGDVFTTNGPQGGDVQSVVLEQELSVSIGGGFTERILAVAESNSNQRSTNNRVSSAENKVAQGGSSGTITTYEYLTDSSVKFNDTTYTIEKNEAGLISKITDSLGNVLNPVVRGEITDIALHNAALWGAVMARGIGQPQLEMPYMQGINYYYIPETRAISDSAWKNSRKGETNNKGDISLPNGAIEDNHALNLKFEQYGQVDTVSSVKIFYCLARVYSSESDLAFPFLFTRAGKDESLGYFIGEGVTKTSGSGQITGHYHRLGVGTNNGCYYARYVSTANDGKITYQSINTTSPKGTFDTSVLKRYFPTEESFNEYHVYTVVAELNGNSDTPFDLYWYIDGERFGSTPSITDNGTQYYLNSISSFGVHFGGLDVSYLAYAMGTGGTYHTPEMVKTNSEWLLKKARGDWKN